MVASANSTEVGVLSNTGEAWTQWIMPGSARAELPLSSEKEETLPIGMTFDISSTTPLPWEESTIPPCPLLCVLSHQGVLHCFNVVYLKPGIPSVCTPPDNVKDTSGLSCFVAKKSQFQTGEIKIGTSQPQIASNDTKFVMAPNLRQISQLHAANTPTKNVTFNFSASSQSTPLAPPKTNTNVASKTLFAGQTTLTPIKPKNQSLFSEQSSITPANQSTIFSALNPTSVPQINTAPIKPIVISAAPVKPIHAAVPRNNLPIKQENQEETDAMMQQMIKDEWMYLEAELKILLKMGGSLKLNIGSDDEKIAMVQQLESLDEFVKEAVEISVGQSNEIHCLKQNLLQSWAWYEEAISHYNASKNEAVALLIKCQPLDTLSEKRLREIKQLDFYIKSQISQAHKTLDEQWDSFQDYAKKTHKVKMPTMETIFLTMVKQNAILQKQILLLKQISFRLTKTSSNDIGNLTAGFEDLTLNPQQIRQLQYDKVKSYSKNLSQGKSKQLKDLLNKREITKVTAVKPQISSFAINQSPSSRVRQSISMLGANVSPAAKASIAKSLSFAQSPTPKTPENIEKSTPSFSSLLKTGPVISSSQGSAFTPIGASSTSNKITTPSFSFAATTSSKNQAPSSTFSSIFKPSSQTATFSFGSTSTSKPASSTSALFGNQANNASFSFSTLSTTTSTGNVEVSKTTTKPPSGVASIFANIQSVIDNATTTTTTTQTTSPTKPLFGSFSSSDSGHLFGSVSKPTASNTTTFSFKATPADKPQLTNVDQNKTSPIIKSEPSKIITVSLFDSKSASDQTNTESGSQSLFGNNTGPIFGNLSATGSSSLFSSSPAATTTTASNSLQSSVIGSSGSIFGNKASSTSTSGPATPTSVFGSTKTTLETSTTTTTTPTAIVAPVTASTSVFVFGTPTTTTSSSVFGTPAASTAPSAFGAPTSSIFGATTTTFGTPSTSSNIFGAPPSAGSNIFSSSTAVFGATPSGNIFASPPISSASAFGAPATNIFSPTTTTSIFGGASTTASPFGSQTGPMFGVTATTTAAGGVFGQPPAFGSQSVFGGAPAAAGSSVFGQAAAAPAVPAASGNIFGSTSSTNVFGSVQLLQLLIVIPVDVDLAEISEDTLVVDGAITDSTFGRVE
ncbi:unnamed protein product [Ceutorhynchus assimilis]|uniref:Nuclear pore complex protein Nup214 n=1 Tax=Ceutorhynchus assimilis TaxID=467358 RepID=A0A9N9QR64_9CUCU|nr:unnamed protein product [Ceutorhynchus assimilis]